MNNRTCIGFSGKNATRNVAKDDCAAVAGGRLFDGDSMNVTELFASATKFLKDQKMTNADWFWIDASYDNASKTAQWSNSSSRYQRLR